MPRENLVVEEAAEYLRTTRGALYAQRCRGENPGALAIKVGRRLLWRVADLEDWLDEQASEQRQELRRYEVA